MVLGLTYGLFFTHMPFVKMSGMAVTSFRTFPGMLFSRISKMLNMQSSMRRYIIQSHAMRDLDALLSDGIPVGCVVGMYYLPYMPFEYRFHFNGHNICIVGKDEQSNEYIVSDPMLNAKVRLSPRDLQKVRFAKGGTYPLLGQMYWINKVPDSLPDMPMLVRKAIHKNCWWMTSQPQCVTFAGVNGIELLSRRITKWEDEFGPRRAALNLAQVIRMLEEIGTGGAGFRFMYAAFLQEAAQMTGVNTLNEFSERMTQIGDMWRDFAYRSARMFKKRSSGEQYTYSDLSCLLHEIAQNERQFFTELNKVV